MALITRYVNTAAASGGNGTTNDLTSGGGTHAYNSMTVAEAGEQDDLTAAGDTLEILCTGTSADTTTTNFSTGWTTSATNFITIKPQLSDVNTTGIYNTSFYRLESQVAYNRNIANSAPCNHIRLEGLQGTSSGAQQSCFQILGDGDCRVTACLVKGVSSTTSTVGIGFAANTAGDYIVTNNIVFDVAGNGLYKANYVGGGTGRVFAANNTAVDCGTGLRFLSGHGAGTWAYNNLLTGNVTDYNVDGTITHADNVTSDATGPNHINKTIVYTNAVDNDFSTSSAEVVGIGKDLTSDPTYAFTVDYLGVTRPVGAWDIGAFQFVPPEVLLVPLPKQFHPEFRPRHIPSVPIEHDTNNVFGRKAVWSFFPADLATEVHPLSSSGQSGGRFNTIGQVLNGRAKVSANSGELRVSPYSGGGGYSGMVIDTIGESQYGGRLEFFGGTTSKISIPDRGSFTIWGLIKPDGPGTDGGSDPRVLSRDNGSGTQNHVYMIGGVRNGGETRARARVRINEVTVTLIITTQDWQQDALNLVAVTFDGKYLIVHHIRQDGDYASLSTAAYNTGSVLTDTSDTSVGLSIGGNYGGNNCFRGETLGAGILDGVLKEAELRNLMGDITQLIAPASPVHLPFVVGELEGGGPVTGTFAVSMEQYLSAMSGLQKLTQSMTGTLGELGETGDGSLIGVGVDGTAVYQLGNTTFSATTSLKLIQSMSNPLSDIDNTMTSKIVVPGATDITFDGLIPTTTNKLTLISTLDNVLVDNDLSATTSQKLTGTASNTLDEVDLTTTTKISLVGSLTPSLSDAVNAVSSQMEMAQVGNINLEQMAASNTGKLTITGSSSFGLGDLVMSNGIDNVILGAFTATLGNLLSSNTSAMKMSATLSPTFAGGTSGATSGQEIQTTINKTLLDTLAVNTAELVLQSAMSSSLNDLISSSSSKATLTGNLSKVLGEITSVFIEDDGTETISGTLNAILADLASVIDTNLYTDGTLSNQLESGSVTNTSSQKMTGTFDATLEDYTNTVTSLLKLVGGIDTSFLDLSMHTQIEGVIGTLPVTDLIYFNTIMTGWLSSSLMKLYYQIVDGLPYGVKYMEEMINENGHVGRFVWEVEFMNGVKILEDNFASFTFAFAQAVSQGGRLPGSTVAERERYLVRSMPLTFNAVWRVPFNLQ